MSKRLDLSGHRFGWLTVQERVIVTGKVSRNAMWICRCDCGNEKVVSSALLRSGNTRSCGCMKKRNFDKRWGRKSAIDLGNCQDKEEAAPVLEHRDGPKVKVIDQTTFTSNNKAN